MEATNNIQTGGVSSFSVQEIKQYPFSPFLDIDAEPADRDLQVSVTKIIIIRNKNFKLCVTFYSVINLWIN
jgi:hypothetical protein